MKKSKFRLNGKQDSNLQNRIVVIIVTFLQFLSFVDEIESKINRICNIIETLHDLF